MSALDASPAPASSPPPEAAYRERLDRARIAVESLERRSAVIANLRAVTFLGAATLAGLALFSKLPGEAWWGSAALTVAYVLLAARHGRVLDAQRRERERVRLNERGLQRLDGGWHRFPERGDTFASPNHGCAPDLDLFGQGSLFQLLDETATRGGEARLASWLLRPAAPGELEERQDAVRELAPLLDFRQALIAESRIAAQDKADPARFVAWVEGGNLLQGIRWARPLALVLPPITLTLFAFAQAEQLPYLYFWLGILVQLAIVGATNKRLSTLFERVSMGEVGFVRFEETFATLEAQPFNHPRLSALRTGLGHANQHPVSARLRRFGRLYAFAALRLSGQLHALLNLTLLWDLHVLFRLEDWRAAEASHVRRWFEALYELEALGSLAGLAHARPGFPFPKRVGGPARFVARELGHPLLEQPVRNDVTLDAEQRLLVITGSNMSGKTTLLRAIGLNAVMAQAGLPVCATSLELSELEVLTSMRVKDSLERGVSYFYAEVERVKALLDAATAAPGRALFLLDELLMGTNTRERQVASRGLVRLLLDTGGVGAMTTHDLALTALADEPGLKARNKHFRDVVDGTTMSFDYRMRDGVVDTTNALRLLRGAGIPIQDEQVPP